MTTNDSAGSPSSSEQLQLALRLESIFMPYSRRQRDALYKRQTGLDHLSVLSEPGRFVHYTSAEAALEIIRTKRIWMRNATCMSDFREVQHGFELLNKFFSDEPKIKAFGAAVDACIPGAVTEAVRRFHLWWQTIQSETFIMSISEHNEKEDLHGRLSMWRAFGGTSARVAFVIKIPWLSGATETLNLLFSPVAYLSESEVHSLFQEVIANVTANQAFLKSVKPELVIGTIFWMLVAGVTCLKHEGFREELEWRAICTPKMRPSPLMEASTEVVIGVPQVVYKIPLDKSVSNSLASLDIATIFDRLIIGPSPYPRAMYQAFVDALTKAGIVSAEKLIFISGIPIRS